ncbi:MAG: prephenate dehydratase [Candidatus Bathyarchaeia archaeon]
MRRVNKKIRPVVAYLGPAGTYTEQAMINYFVDSVPKYQTCGTLLDIFRAVTSNKALYGVVPLENSTDGSVNATLDLLYREDLKICGEVEEEVRHCLIVRPKTTLQSVKVVISHPQALAQCRDFLVKHFPHAKTMEADSTASAVRITARAKDAAAIGSERAARTSRLKIALDNIADNPNNFTRFAVIAKNDAVPTGNDKTSTVFAMKNVAGALHKALEPFAKRRINLTKIESRPTRDKPWEYIFFMDFEGHHSDRLCNEALEEMKKFCQLFKLLGSYPKANKL